MATTEETTLIYERYRLYTLAQHHPHWSQRAYARELGHDPKWVSTWLKRFRQANGPSLTLFTSHSRRPHSTPTRLDPMLEERICQLRPTLSEQFHRRAGGKTIAAILRRELPPDVPVPDPRTIHDVLKRRGVIVPRSRPKPQPLVLPPPMAEWEMDFGEIYLGPAEGSFEFFLVVDRGTSRVIYLEGGPGYNAETALLAVARLFILHGLPKRLRFDRDPRLWGSWTRDSYPSPLGCFLRCLGVEDVVCPPRRPDLKPFVERCIQTLKYEWFARHAPETIGAARDLLEPFVRYHNHERPHQGQACQNRTPDEAFPVLPTLPHVPDMVQADVWVKSLHGRVYRRRVSSSGAIQVDRYSYSVGEAWAKQQVLVHVDAARAVFQITCNGQKVKTLPMKGLLDATLPFGRFVDYMRDEARIVTRHRTLWWEQEGPPF